MATKQRETFFEKDTPHGLVKRTMYKKYLQAYVAKTQAEKFSFRTVIIDGFAGCGRYSNDWPREIEKYGSPLIAVMVTLDYQFKRQKEHGPIFGWDSERLDPEEELAQLREFRGEGDNMALAAKVSMYFIEKKKKNYKKLVRNLQLLVAKFLQNQFPDLQYKFYQNKDKKTTDISVNDAPFSFRIQVFNMEFTSFEAPSKLRYYLTRSLTFLDPCGYSQTPFEHVNKFAPTEGNEIFITFMSQYINRFMKRHPSQVLKLYGVDEKDVDRNLQEFVEYVTRGLEGAELPSLSKIKRCTYTYEKCLRQKTDSSFLQTFEVRDIGNKIIYHLIHVTNHIRGVEAMKEAMNRCSQEKGEMAMSDYSILRLGQKLNFGNLDDPEEVASVIYEQFEGRKRILLKSSPEGSNERGRMARYNEQNIPEYESISDFVTLGTKFLFRKKPLKLLQKQHKIEDVVNEMGKAPRRKRTFPDEDNKTGIPNQWYISFAQKKDVGLMSVAGKPKKQSVENDQLDSKTQAQAIFEKFQGRTRVALKPYFDASNKAERKARSDDHYHLEYRTIYEYITHGTQFKYSKKPLIILWKEHKIIKVVNQDGDPPKRKYTFPDQDRETKRRYQWYISFAENRDGSVQSNTEKLAVIEKLDHQSRIESPQPSGSSTEQKHKSSKSARKRVSEKNTTETRNEKKRKLIKMEVEKKENQKQKSQQVTRRVKVSNILIQKAIQCNKLSFKLRLNKMQPK